jgi:Domain of unknown function (DUF4116)
MQEFLQNYAATLQLVKRYGLALGNLNTELKKDKAIVMKAVSQNR